MRTSIPLLDLRYQLWLRPVDGINISRVSAGAFACFRVVRFSVFAGHTDFCDRFDSRQLHWKGRTERPFSVDDWSHTRPSTTIHGSVSPTNLL